MGWAHHRHQAETPVRLRAAHVAGASVPLRAGPAPVPHIAGRLLRQGGTDPFLHTGRVVLVGCLVFLAVGNIFGGFSLFWVFLGVSLNRMTKPAPKPQMVTQTGAPPMPWDVPQSALG